MSMREALAWIVAGGTWLCELLHTIKPFLGVIP
jgi:hypothetical protein